MQYTTHNLRIGLNNAESSLRWFADKNLSTMTMYDEKAIVLNMARVANFLKMLDSSKQFSNKKYF